MASALAVTVAEKLESHPSLRPVYGAGILDGSTKRSMPEKVARRAHDARRALGVRAAASARPNWKARSKSGSTPSSSRRTSAAARRCGWRRVVVRRRARRLLDSARRQPRSRVLQKANWSTDADVDGADRSGARRRISTRSRCTGRALNDYLRARRAARSGQGGDAAQEGEPHRSQVRRGASHARRRLPRRGAERARASWQYCLRARSQARLLRGDCSGRRGCFAPRATACAPQS